MEKVGKTRNESKFCVATRQGTIRAIENITKENRKTVIPF